MAAGSGSQRTEITIHDSTICHYPPFVRNARVLQAPIFHKSVVRTIRYIQKVGTKWVCNCEDTPWGRTPSEKPKVASC